MSDELLETSSADWLVPFLLLGLREQACYGDELTRKMSNFGFRDRYLEEMYRALRQMEEESLIVSERDGFEFALSQRRYSIKEEGRAYLEFWANSLEQYREEIDLFFRLYKERPVLAQHS